MITGSPIRWRLPLVVALVVMVAGCTAEPDSEADQSGGPPDWEQLYLEEVESLAASFEQENGQPAPDDAEFVRFIESSEYGEVHAECIREQGFGAEATFDHGVEYDPVPPEQGVALHEAIFRCQVAYPVHPRYSLPWTDEMIRTLYDYYVDELVPCLTAEGYTLQEAPSWESFLADYGTERTWTPYAVVDAGTPEEWQQINETCPQGPPSEELFGTG